MMLLMITPTLVDGANNNNNNNITCGPSGSITMAGSTFGVRVAKLWAKDYHRACPSTNISVTSNSTIIGAKRVCAVSSVGNAVDIGIMSRPFNANEAILTNTTNGYNYKCAQGKRSRRTIQVEMAIDAVVLVVAVNGSAAYCIEQLYNNQLSLEQLRILFSNYTLAQLLNISTNSPSTLSPTKTNSPTISTPFPTFEPTTSVAPTISPSDAPSTVQPVAVCTIIGKCPPQPTKAPVAIKPPMKKPTKHPTHKPSHRPTIRSTHRPTLPTKTIHDIDWTFFYSSQYQSRAKAAAVMTECSAIQALVAGPPHSSEVYQYFAQTILQDYGQGRESITPTYYSGSSVSKIVNFLRNNTNAIGILPLSDYVANKKKLVAINLQHVNGNEGWAPNTTTLMAGLYPLGNQIYMEVRSDNVATLNRVRPFVEFAFSDKGDKDVVSTGLVALPNASQVTMLSRLA